MAVIKTDESSYPDTEQACILCLRDFTDGEPVVMWEGPKRMYLHGGCAGSFVLRLARDAWAVERDADDGKFTITPHTARQHSRTAQFWEGPALGSRGTRA